MKFLNLRSWYVWIVLNLFPTFSGKETFFLWYGLEFSFFFIQTGHNKLLNGFCYVYMDVLIGNKPHKFHNISWYALGYQMQKTCVCIKKFCDPNISKTH